MLPALSFLADKYQSSRSKKIAPMMLMIPAMIANSSLMAPIRMKPPKTTIATPNKNQNIINAIIEILQQTI